MHIPRVPAAIERDNEIDPHAVGKKKRYSVSATSLKQQTVFVAIVSD
jgi:hypothetical protein